MAAPTAESRMRDSSAAKAFAAEATGTDRDSSGTGRVATAEYTAFILTLPEIRNGFDEHLARIHRKLAVNAAWIRGEFVGKFAGLRRRRKRMA